MHKEQHIFSVSRTVFVLLVAGNLALAFWLDFSHGSALGWIKFTLSAEKTPGWAEALSVLQFLLLAFTLDQYFRRVITRFNRRTQQRSIPAILVQIISILTYALVGLAGFILLYEKSIATLLAFSSAIGLAAAYAARDVIADMSASVQLQIDRLVAIDEWLDILDGASPGIYQIIQMDRQLISLRNPYDQLIKIPNKRFLGLTYVNLSRQESGSRREVDLQLETPHNESRILEILNASLESLYQLNNDFYGEYSCLLKHAQTGFVVYRLSYHCKPHLKIISADHAVLRSALRFLKASGINLESSVNLRPQIAAAGERKSRLWNLYELGLLKVLSQQELLHLADRVPEHRYLAGAQVITAGHLADSMYIIAEGSLEVRLSKEDGSSVYLATLWPGDCVGEMSLLTGAPRSADVFAKSNAILLELTKHDLAPLLSTNQDLADGLAGQMIERNSHREKILNTGLNAESTESLRKKLAKKILGFFGLSN